MMMNIDNFDELNPSVDDILLMEDEQELGEESEERAGDTEEEKYDMLGTECGSEDSYIGDSMQMYLASIGRIPLLTAEKEIELGEKIREGGEESFAARNELVQANLRLVVHYAKRFLGRGIELEDLNAMGIEGLIKAAEKFDYTMGFRFSTYASWWIKQAISRGIADEVGTVRIPVHMSETIQRVRSAQRCLNQEKGKEPTVAEIAEYLSVPEKTVIEATNAMFNIISFDTKVGEDGETTFEDFLADENVDDPCDAAICKGLKEAVQSVLGQLYPKEALVLSLRFGIGVPYAMTLEDIAKLPNFGVTRERIRQIESKALRKIRRSPRMSGLLKDFAA